MALTISKLNAPDEPGVVTVKRARMIAALNIAADEYEDNEQFVDSEWLDGVISDLATATAIKLED